MAGVGGRAYWRRQRALDYLILEQQIGHEIFARRTECRAQYLMHHPPAKTQREAHAAAMLPWITRTVVPYLPVIKSLIPALEVETRRWYIAAAVGAYRPSSSGMQTPFFYT